MAYDPLTGTITDEPNLQAQLPQWVTDQTGQSIWSGTDRPLVGPTGQSLNFDPSIPVSYTHLTLPTNREV